MDEPKFINAARYILKERLNYVGPTIEEPQYIIEDGHARVFSGNICLNLYDGSDRSQLEKFPYHANASKQLGQGNSPNEHFVCDGFCRFDGKAIGWYLTSRN